MSQLLSVNPFTLEVIQSYVCHSEQDINNMLDGSVAASAHWKRRSIEERLFCLQALKRNLFAQREGFAKLIVAEMGKLYREALAEIDKSMSLCDYYLADGLEVLKGRSLSSDAKSSGVLYEPMGIVLGIMPWNFPFWQAFRFLVPALMAGNVVLLKHAGNVTGCSLAIERLFGQSFPFGCVRSILLHGSDMERIIQHPAIAAISLTGSEQVGRKVASVAGSALKPLVLELGGSDPLIIFGDADLEQAARMACISRFQNAGQSCIAAKRFLVHRSIKQDFLDKLKNQIAGLVLGDPMDSQTGIAPLAKSNFVQDLHKQVQTTLAEGGELLLGGSPFGENNAFYLPTIIDNVTPFMTAGREELFGPVAAIMSFAEPEEAISLANSTRFGLGSAVFTFNQTLINLCKNELQAGSVFINGMVKSHPGLPFGGTKASGYGRELANEGLLAFSNPKTFWEMGEIS
mgnify:CR=1 FL=1